MDLSDVLQAMSVTHFSQKWLSYFLRLSFTPLSKVARVVNCSHRVMLQVVISLTTVIYNCNLFIIQATAYDNLAIALVKL